MGTGCLSREMEEAVLLFEKDKGYAIKIKNINKYTTPLSLKEAYGVTPPQSFVYVS